MSGFSQRILVCLILIALVASTGLAQTSTSRITGTVTDSTGALVSGATVTAKNEATGVAQTHAGIWLREAKRELCSVSCSAYASRFATARSIGISTASCCAVVGATYIKQE